MSCASNLQVDNCTYEVTWAEICCQSETPAWTISLADKHYRPRGHHASTEQGFQSKQWFSREKSTTWAAEGTKQVAFISSCKRRGAINLGNRLSLMMRSQSVSLKFGWGFSTYPWIFCTSIRQCCQPSIAPAQTSCLWESYALFCRRMFSQGILSIQGTLLKVQTLKHVHYLVLLDDLSNRAEVWKSFFFTAI